MKTTSAAISELARKWRDARLLHSLPAAVKTSTQLDGTIKHLSHAQIDCFILNLEYEGSHRPNLSGFFSLSTLFK